MTSVTFLPQASIRAPRNVGLDPSALARLAQGVRNFGLQQQQNTLENQRRSDLADIALMVQQGASNQQIAGALAGSQSPDLAELGLRAQMRANAQAATQQREIEAENRRIQQQIDAEARKIVRDQAGVPRVRGTGERVFPNVTLRVDLLEGAPAGMMFEDETRRRLVPIPGGPVAEEREAAQRQQRQRQQQTQTAGDIVLTDIDRSIDLIEGEGVTSPATGLTGQVMSNVGGTRASNLNSLLTTVRANVGFDRLNQMRQASPTGGALGNVTERELAQLNNVLGSLEQSQSAGQLTFNLQRLRNTYLDIVHGVGNGPPRTQLTAPRDDTPTLQPRNPVAPDRSSGVRQPARTAQNVPNPNAAPRAGSGGNAPLVPQQPATPPAQEFPQPSQEAIFELLRQQDDPQALREFDEIFGDGAAQRILDNST